MPGLHWSRAFDVSGGAMTGPIAPLTFGLDLSAVFARFDQLEALVATAAEEITALSAKVDDIAADFRAFRDAMLAERENLTAAGQAALDDAIAKLDALDTEVGEHDGQPTP